MIEAVLEEQKKLDALHGEEFEGYHEKDIPEKIRFLQTRMKDERKPIVHQAVHLLVTTYREARMYDEAKRLGDRFLDEILEHDHYFAGSILRDLGVIYKIEGNMKKGMEFLRRTLKTLNSSPDREFNPFLIHELGFCYFDIADIFLRKSEHEKAYPFAKKSLEMFYSLDEFFNVADCILVQTVATSFSDICLELNLRNESTKTLMRHLKVFEKYKDQPVYKPFFRDLRLSLIKMIAANFYKIGYVSTSIELNKKCLSILDLYPLEQRQDPEYILNYVEILRTLCLVYFHKTDRENLEKYRRMIPQHRTGIPKVEEWKRDVEKYDAFLSLKKNKKMKKLIRRECKKEKIKNCHTCGIEDGTKKCGVCKFFFYCSRDCQKKDWKEHKVYCCNLIKI